MFLSYLFQLPYKKVHKYGYSNLQHLSSVAKKQTKALSHLHHLEPIVYNKLVSENMDLDFFPVLKNLN